MKYNFDEFNFNVIDVTTRGAVDILINPRGITISRGVADEMGYPAFVRMLVDSESKVFAIQACKQTDENAYKFSKPKGEQLKPINCQTAAVKQIIRSLMADTWNDGDSYRINGVYYRDAKAMVFNLKSATNWKWHNE